MISDMNHIVATIAGLQSCELSYLNAVYIVHATFKQLLQWLLLGTVLIIKKLHYYIGVLFSPF